VCDAELSAIGGYRAMGVVGFDVEKAAIYALGRLRGVDV
jgi:hypothetical protein